MSADLRIELRLIQTAFRALITSSRTARFAWTGKAATLQYEATKRGQAALERLAELEAEILAARPAAIGDDVLRPLELALEAVQWSRSASGGTGRPSLEEIDALAAAAESLIRRQEAAARA